MASPSPRPLARDYRDPHTKLGIDLTAFSGVGASSFLLHECGFLHYENWNHRGILSPYWRLHHNFETGNAVRSDGAEFSLDPNSVVIIPGGVALDTLGRETVPHLWIHFVPSQEFMLAMHRPVSLAADRVMQETLRALRDDIESAPSAEPRRSLHHLAKALLHLAFAKLDPSSFQAYPDRLVRLLEHIEAHLSQTLSTPALARVAGMSRHRFTEWFQRHIGQTPSRYVADLRLRTAMQRLATTEASIEQVAEDLGYPNRYYFSRVFQKSLGCGPATFRRGQRE